MSATSDMSPMETIPFTNANSPENGDGVVPLGERLQPAVGRDESHASLVRAPTLGRLGARLPELPDPRRHDRQRATAARLAHRNPRFTTRRYACPRSSRLQRGHVSIHSPNASPSSSIVASRSWTKATVSRGSPHRRQAKIPPLSALVRLYTSTPTLAGRWITWKNLPNGMKAKVSTTVAMWMTARNW